MRHTTRATTAIAIAGIVGATLTGASAAQPDGSAAQPEDPGAQAQNPVYFVHGWGDEAKDCTDTWGNAVEHFAETEGMAPSKLHMLQYYDGDYADDDACNERAGGELTYADISGDGENDGTNDTRIRHVAAAFAHQLADEHDGEKIDIVAHSMGGLITRVALLGTAQGWDDFPTDSDGSPAELNVDDVVTLGTPHQGVIQKFGNTNDDTQWKSMDPDSEFMRVLHLPENRLSRDWAQDVDWSFVGSNEDDTVTGESAIDIGFHADHKYLYRGGNELEVTHGTIRTFVAGDHHFNLRHTHVGEGTTDTTEGRAPVALAWRAITDKDR
ncbi:hypothetical protein IQ251_17765 [Saccharopolyspora sp. HNM0983]|uniref:DUF676 domain-containing protein n=1 Tax=Saccharopolyspora montiporae TaxID=2781240 RepID=A0A929BDD5_9PSEU|nr:hypothetical protein [Saccharopolyspora sp. HNM0983]MBE9376300.1 hypothetical protein [Saccharopolyspora sp. HNM0983]